jgi:hypothetical protein
MASSPPSPVSLQLTPDHRIACAGLEAADLAIRPDPEGGLRVSAKAIVARRAHIESPAITAEFASAELVDVTAHVTHVDGALALQALSAREIRVMDLRAAVPRAALQLRGPMHGVVLDALAELDGVVHAFITDALWFIDADIVMPIDQGAIDFNRVEVRHVGPNSALGIGPAEIYVETAGKRRVDVLTLTTPSVPGASFGTRSRVPFVPGDHGRLDLCAFLAARLQLAPGQRFARFATGAISGALERTRIAGELRLGDGALAVGEFKATLQGRTEGRNRVNVTTPSLAQRIVIGLPALAVAKASALLAGRRFTASSITAAFDAHLLREAPGQVATSPALLLSVAQATIGDARVAPVAAEPEA